MECGFLFEEFGECECFEFLFTIKRSAKALM